MWNGKKKAVTFSFDDGVTQDIRLIEILDKYGLKCTFNLNSEFLGLDGTLDRNGHIVRHDKIAKDKIKEVYGNHEVAVHTLTHPFLPSLEKDEIIRQVETDRLNLSEICGYEVKSWPLEPDMVFSNDQARDGCGNLVFGLRENESVGFMDIRDVRLVEEILEKAIAEREEV